MTAASMLINDSLEPTYACRRCSRVWDGRHTRLPQAPGSVHMLILDDCGLEPLNDQALHDLLNILEERHDPRHQPASCRQLT